MSSPLDANLLTRDQALIALRMVSDHAASHHVRAKALITMLRLKLESDPEAVAAFNEWEAVEDEEYAALQRALLRLPDGGAPVSQRALN